MFHFGLQSHCGGEGGGGLLQALMHGIPVYFNTTKWMLPIDQRIRWQ